tara:strand:+ start:13370 stop:14482 length:1113 start_codon:yes stop_codon:yes gene_type:complete
MIQLKTKGEAININNIIIAKVISNRMDSAKICFSPAISENVILSVAKSIDINATSKVVYRISSLSYLNLGDILLINPNGIIYTLFREKSNHNSLFITDRCNSNCLMCSQPPKNKDDLDYYFEINSQLIKMIPSSTPVLGITGGEPLLLGERFITLLLLITKYLPKTQVHVLTNGRQFAWKNIPCAINQVNNDNIIFGIPLYSSYFREHDYIVQAENAFYQTVIGFHNMASYGLRLELRIVLHKQTYLGLPKLANYIYKNLPFVEHVAFMGLEYTGYTPFNNDLLWVEPREYLTQLEEAVLYLDQMDISVSIYNLQLCLLKPTLWKFTRNSISDWKKEYLEECSSCTLLQECGGVFATSKKHSKDIKAIMT